jgi:hypothetical protein
MMQIEIARSPPRLHDCLLQAITEQCTIREVGQDIEMRQILYLLGSLLPFRNVAGGCVQQLLSVEIVQA